MRTLLMVSLEFLAWSCSQPVDLEAEKARLLRINEEQRRAHITNDATLLVASMADSLITVDKGYIYRSSREQVEARFSGYFQTVKYFKWDDMEPPVIHIEPSGNMATVSVRKEVIATGSTGATDTTIFAWTSVYKKAAGAWKMYSITSTDDR